MTNAFLGLSARVEAAHAALIAADALAVLGRPVTLVRLTLPGEAPLPPRSVASDSVDIVERELPDAAASSRTLARDIPAAVCADREVILDLPVACIGDPDVAARIDLAVVAVGPSPFAEYEAAGLVASLAGRSCPLWLMACGRSGGGAAVAALSRQVSVLAAAAGAEGGCRVLPAGLPALGRHDAERVIDGDRTARTLRAGLALVAALRTAAADRFAPHADPDAFAAQMIAAGGDARLPDQRDAYERLYDLADELADELAAIGEGTKPRDADLADVPLLRDWAVETRAVNILTGRVFNHPGIPDGRRISTSDLYASDGESWARTLSRYYVLRDRASDPRARTSH